MISGLLCSNRLLQMINLTWYFFSPFLKFGRRKVFLFLQLLHTLITLNWIVRGLNWWNCILTDLKSSKRGKSWFSTSGSNISKRLVRTSPHSTANILLILLDCFSCKLFYCVTVNVGMKITRLCIFALKLIVIWVISLNEFLNLVWMETIRTRDS